MHRPTVAKLADRYWGGVSDLWVLSQSHTTTPSGPGQELETDSRIQDRRMQSEIIGAYESSCGMERTTQSQSGTDSGPRLEKRYNDYHSED